MLQDDHHLARTGATPQAARSIARPTDAALAAAHARQGATATAARSVARPGRRSARSGVAAALAAAALLAAACGAEEATPTAPAVEETATTTSAAPADTAAPDTSAAPSTTAAPAAPSPCTDPDAEDLGDGLVRLDGVVYELSADACVPVAPEPDDTVADGAGPDGDADVVAEAADEEPAADDAPETEPELTDGSDAPATEEPEATPTTAPETAEPETAEPAEPETPAAEPEAAIDPGLDAMLAASPGGEACRQVAERGGEGAVVLWDTQTNYDLSAETRWVPVEGLSPGRWQSELCVADPGGAGLGDGLSNFALTCFADDPAPYALFTASIVVDADDWGVENASGDPFEAVSLIGPPLWVSEFEISASTDLSGVTYLLDRPFPACDGTLQAIAQSWSADVGGWVAAFTPLASVSGG